MTAPARRWNHNLHHHPLILDAVPGGCQRALDVGCGEGILARELRQLVPRVSAIDLHQPSIRLARRRDNGAGVEYLVGDFLTYPFEPASFDLITSAWVHRTVLAPCHVLPGQRSFGGRRMLH